MKSKEKKIFNLYGIDFIVESKLKWWIMKLQPWKYREVMKGVMLKK